MKKFFYVKNILGAIQAEYIPQTTVGKIGRMLITDGATSMNGLGATECLAYNHRDGRKLYISEYEDGKCVGLPATLDFESAFDVDQLYRNV